MIIIIIITLSDDPSLAEFGNFFKYPCLMMTRRIDRSMMTRRIDTVSKILLQWPPTEHRHPGECFLVRLQGLSAIVCCLCK